MTCKDRKMSSGMGGFCHSYAPPQFKFRKSCADCISLQFAPLSLNTRIHRCPHSAQLEASWIGAVLQITKIEKKLKRKEDGVSLISVHWVTSWPPALSPPALHPHQKGHANTCTHITRSYTHTHTYIQSQYVIIIVTWAISPWAQQTLKLNKPRHR